MKRIFLLALMLGVSACGGDKGSPTGPSAAVQTGGSSRATSAGTSKALTSAAPVPYHILHPVEFPMSAGIVAFPPRNEPNVFFADLQGIYRDVLRRAQTAPTYVDSEGENVWLTEYFRFYLNGCSHADAMSRTLTEITTGSSLPTCGSENLVFPPRDLPFEFQSRLEATYRDVLRRPLIASYVDSEGANVWLAQYLRFRVSGCGHADAENKVFTEIRGGGVQPACSGSSGSGSSSTVTGTVAALGINRHLITILGGTTLGLGLAWSNPATDLDLYLTLTSCSGYPPLSCNILAASQRNSGTVESVGRAGVRAGDQFYAWVDNFSNRSESYALASVVTLTRPDGEELQFTVGPGEPQASKPAGFSKTHN